MKIGFIGSGNMATALAKGFISSKKVLPEDVFISSRTAETLAKWENTGVNTTIDNKVVCKECDFVIFAVKPNVLPLVLNQTKSLLKEKLVLSIAAGTTIKTMEEILAADTKIIRCMPNTPAQVGCGMTVLAPNSFVSQSEAEEARELFDSVGSAIILEEKYINAATALHGSSPAYVYMMIEAMANSGVKYGIPKNISIALAAKAVEGAAKMVLETNRHPAELKDAVCSPGGTTIAAVMELENNGFLSSISSAIDACIKKADEMSKN